MTIEYSIEDRNNFFNSGSDLYWDDIKNPSHIPYDEDVIDIVKFEDDMYRSWIDWCNTNYADVDDDENVYLMEEDWWCEYKDTFNAENYKK